MSEDPESLIAQVKSAYAAERNKNGKLVSEFLAARRRQGPVSGVELVALREVLSEGAKTRGRAAVTQESIARSAEKAKLIDKVTSKRISRAETSTAPIKKPEVQALCRAFRVVEEENDLDLDYDPEIEPDRRPVVSNWYSYTPGLRNLLEEEVGHPRAKSIAFDAVVFAGNRARIDSILAHTRPIVAAGSHARERALAQRDLVDQEAALSAVDKLCVSLTIRIKGLHYKEGEDPVFLEFGHCGGAQTVWRAVHGLSEPIDAFLPSHTTEAFKFHDGLHTRDGLGALAYESTIAPYISPGSLVYRVENTSQDAELTIRLVALNAFDPGSVLGVGCPVNLSTQRADIAVALETSVAERASTPSFKTYSDRRTYRGPGAPSVICPSLRHAHWDSRLRGRTDLRGHRLTIRRPWMGQIYGFTWEMNNE